MANEVKIKVTVENDSKKGLGDVGKDLDGVSIKAYGAEKAMDSLSANMTESDRKASGTARALNSVEKELEQLDRQLAMSTAEMRIFASALTATDDAAQRMDITKAMSKLQADISNTSKAKKIKLAEMIDLKPDPSTIGKLTGSLTKMFSEASIGAGPTIGIALGATVGPVVASALAAAVVGGIGIGGIAGGVALAAKDARVQASAKAIGSTFMSEITARGAVFIKPVLDSLKQVQDYAGVAGKKIGDIFDATKDSLAPFTASLLRAGDVLLNSFVHAAQNSGPAIDALGDSLELITKGVGHMIDVFADMGPEAAGNLRILGGVIGDTISLLGDLIGWFSDTANSSYLLGGALKYLREHYDEGTGHTIKMSTANKGLSGSMDAVAKSADEERSAMSVLTKELRNQNDPVFRLLSAQDKLAESQKAASEATKKHGKSSVEARQALRNLGMAALDLRTAVGAVQGSFDGKLSPAMRRTLEAAGLTKGQIKGLETEFRRAKGAADALAGNYVVRVTTIREEKNRGYAGNSATGGRAHGGIVGAAATGGIHSGLTLVGESGPELAQLPPGTTVHPAGTTRNMMAQGLAGGAQQVDVLVSAAPRAGADLMSVIIEGLRYEIRRQGGIVQTVLGKRVTA